jgi:translation initiation factor 5B
LFEGFTLCSSQGSYVHHKELRAAQGIKITAQGLESAVAGTQLYVVGPDDDPDDIMEEAMQDMNSILSRVDKSGEGVCVQVSASCFESWSNL